MEAKKPQAGGLTGTAVQSGRPKKQAKARQVLRCLRGVLAPGALLLIAALTAPVAEANAQTMILRPGGGESPQASPPPESVAEERVAQFVAAVNMAGPAAMKAYVGESGLARPNSPRAVDFIFNILAKLRAHTDGVELVSSRMAGPLVEVVLRNRLTGWSETVELHLDPEPPHHLQGTAVHSLRPPADVPAGPLTDERLVQETEAFMSALERADVFSGAVLLARGDSILFADAYGEANKELGVPNRLDTRFSLASLNKMFTAVAIAQLVEAGKLSFEDPLSKFLPDHFAPGVAEKIRIEHLLTHTSGLGDYLNQGYRERPRESLRTIDGVLEVTRGDSLAFEPGTGQLYSNTGFLVLGKIVELVSGQDYHDYVRERIYRPAGMENTTEDATDQGTAVGYMKRYTEQEVQFENTLSSREARGGPAGGGYSTVGDLHRFALALMGGKLVSPAMAETLITPKPELSSPRYGFGFGRSVVEDAERSDRLVTGHNGGFPGVSTQLDMVPATGHVFVVLSNYGDDTVFRPLAVRKLFLR